MTTIINDFGTAPDVAPRTSYHLDKEVKGTDEDILRQFAGVDAVIVKSSAVHGEPDTFMYGVFKPNATLEAALQ